jgi:hypothetical protein
MREKLGSRSIGQRLWSDELISRYAVADILSAKGCEAKLATDRDRSQGGVNAIFKRALLDEEGDILRANRHNVGAISLIRDHRFGDGLDDRIGNRELMVEITRS